MRFIYQIIVNAIAIIGASRYISGFTFSGSIISLLWVSFLLTLVNYFLKPVLKLITIPIILLTLGLFTIVINMFLLYLVDRFTPELMISGIVSLFWATILFGVINTVFSIIKK